MEQQRPSGNIFFKTLIMKLLPMRTIADNVCFVLLFLSLALGTPTIPTAFKMECFAIKVGIWKLLLLLQRDLS